MFLIVGISQTIYIVLVPLSNEAPFIKVCMSLLMFNTYGSVMSQNFWVARLSASSALSYKSLIECSQNNPSLQL